MNTTISNTLFSLLITKVSHAKSSQTRNEFNFKRKWASCDARSPDIFGRKWGTRVGLHIERAHETREEEKYLLTRECLAETYALPDAER